MLHGSISLTSTAVAVTGILGANVNKELLSLLGIYPFVARGIAVGARCVVAWNPLFSSTCIY